MHTLPAIGNSLNRFFTTGSGGGDSEPRIYQCIQTKDSYECIKQTSGMLVPKESTVVTIPKVLPEVLDGMYLWGVMARMNTICCRPQN